MTTAWLSRLLWPVAKSIKDVLSWSGRLQVFDDHTKILRGVSAICPWHSLHEGKNWAQRKPGGYAEWGTQEREGGGRTKKIHLSLQNPVGQALEVLVCILLCSLDYTRLHGTRWIRTVLFVFLVLLGSWHYAHSIAGYQAHVGTSQGWSWCMTLWASSSWSRNTQLSAKMPTRLIASCQQPASCGKARESLSSTS